MNTTFDQWNPEAKASYQLRDTFRYVYITPNNVDLYDHWVSPRNFLKPSYGYTVVGLTLPKSKDVIDLITQYGGEPDLDENWYTDEGFGLAVFRGEGCLKKAFEFVMKEKDTLGKLWAGAYERIKPITGRVVGLDSLPIGKPINQWTINSCSSTI